MKKALLLFTVVLAAGHVFGQSNPQAVRKMPVSVTLKTDTVVYRVDHKMMPDTRIYQLLRAMPSFEIAADGAVMHQGQVVKKVTINGKTYAGLTPLKVIQRLPVEILENMEMIDDYSNAATYTFKNPAPDKLLNLNIIPNAIADIDFYLSNRPSRPIGAPRGRYDDPNLYGNINYINERNPLERQVNRAVRNMLAISDQMNEVDQYGDQIPHFLIQAPYPARDIYIKKGKGSVKNPTPRAVEIKP